MTRKEKLFCKINLKNKKGLEVGALDHPTLMPGEGDIEYLDYTTTEALRKAHANNPFVKVDQIVQVKHVWGEEDLSVSVGKEVYDYVIASHVIEHVPDVITWLREISSILKKEGVFTLIVPDKRFIFDAKRNLTTTGDLLEAFYNRQRKPTIKNIFDYISRHVHVNVEDLWAGRANAEDYKNVHTPTEAMEFCNRLIQKNEYVDAHCWVFTPISLITILQELVELKLLEFEVASFFPSATNEIDFFISLRKLTDSPERTKIQQDSIRQAMKVAIAAESEWRRKLQTSPPPLVLRSLLKIKSGLKRVINGLIQKLRG